MKENPLLNQENDLCGKALYDYYLGNQKDDLLINTSYGDVEEMPAEVFFRDFEDFPVIEALAIEQCKGKVLDVGAGTGCHSLILQDKGLNVTPIDISPFCVKIMQDRGIEQVKQKDFFEVTHEKYDTLLFLMNGLGLVGKIKNLSRFLRHCANLLNPQGQIIVDSSDVNYLIEEFNIQPDGKYIGEIAYQYVYENKKGPWFDWLYLEKALLQQFAEQEGWLFNLLYEDETAQYLAVLSKK